MKRRFVTLAFLLSCASGALAQSGYTNFIRQTQLPSGVKYDVPVAAEGSMKSYLPIDTVGADFHLYSVSATTSYLLDSTFVGAYLPQAKVTILAEDTYADTPRTRIDRPFTVRITTSDLLSGANAPQAAKSVRLLHYVQSYGSTYGENVNPAAAVFHNQTTINQNGTLDLVFPATSISDSAIPISEIRGEERFSIYCQDSVDETGNQIKGALLSSRTIQIWPMPSASIQGIVNGQKLRFQLPPLVFSYQNLYPNSTTIAQAYPGAPALGKSGTIIAGGGPGAIFQGTPMSVTLPAIRNYQSVFDRDGQWTIEIIHTTPFGVERLAYVTFHLDRTMKINSMLSSLE